MEPRKDYEDYSRFINDTYADEKVNMLSQTVQSQKGHFSKFYNPTNTLRAHSSSRNNNDGVRSKAGGQKH